MSMSGICTPPRIEEALEDQAVLDRIEIGDSEAVGDDRAGRTAPSRADPDLALAGKPDQVPDDQEVGGETHFVDHR